MVDINFEMIWVLTLLCIAVYFFVTNKLRVDIVAILMILAFILSNTLNVQEALSGFSDPSVILIAALFIIGEGLVRTGIAFKMGEMIIQKSGNSELKVTIFLMLAVALLGSVMSSTGVVAIFIPVVMSVCLKMNISPSKLMMPLSFASLISGMMTLVATAPNLVVNSELVKSGFKGFGFFGITPIGLIILVMGIIYMLFARKWLIDRSDKKNESLKKRTMGDFVEKYALKGKTHRVRIRPNSPLADKTLLELGLRSKYNLHVLGIERIRKFGQKVTIVPTNTLELRVEDILLVNTTEENVDMKQVCKDLNLTELPLRGEYFSDQGKQVGMAEIMFSPISELYGKSLKETSLKNNLNVNVVGILRKGEPLKGNLLDVTINLGDTILVVGDWKAIRHMQTSSDIVVLNLPAEIDEVAPAFTQAPQALFSLGVMVFLMVTGLVPNVAAAFIGCLLMGLFRCVDMDSAYKSIHWPSLILIVGMMPFAIALQKTGAINLAVEGLLATVGGLGERAILASLFILCAVIGLFISNTATAVLMAPIAIALANQLEVSPYPFAMIVTLAASSAFMTPVSSPVNTLVYSPGRYKFTDFVKIGVPFTILVLIMSVIVVPILFPFKPTL